MNTLDRINNSLDYGRYLAKVVEDDVRESIEDGWIDANEVDEVIDYMADKIIDYGSDHLITPAILQFLTACDGYFKKTGRDGWLWDPLDPVMVIDSAYVLDHDLDLTFNYRTLQWAFLVDGEKIYGERAYELYDVTSDLELGTPIEDFMVAFQNVVTKMHERGEL